jgi:pimeloyl-ACP methyl ester carboxylesterase
MLRMEQLDRDLDEELNAHIQMRTEDNIASGMPAEEARHDARQRFGNATLTKEDTRAMDITPSYLSTIQARTLIVQGDRDPLYPIEISVEMARAIPHSSLWVIPEGGHGPVIGERWPEFVRTAMQFLLK